MNVCLKISVMSEYSLIKKAQPKNDKHNEKPMMTRFSCKN